MGRSPGLLGGSILPSDLALSKVLWTSPKSPSPSPTPVNISDKPVSPGNSDDNESANSVKVSTILDPISLMVSIKPLINPGK